MANKTAQPDGFWISGISEFLAPPFSRQTVKARQARKNVEVWVRGIRFC
ncbi:hypothetical protein [Rhodohalobacter sp. 8-1]